MGRLRKPMFVSLLLSVTVIGCAAPQSTDASGSSPSASVNWQLTVPAMNEIKSMEEWASVLPGSLRVTGTPRTHARQIAQVLGWLQGARVVSYENPPPGKGGYPPGILLTLNDGRMISLGPAVDWAVKKLPNGATEIDGPYAKGYVACRYDDMNQPIRIYSPALYNWMMGGWRTDFMPSEFRK